jgi:hypothetical protein
MDNTFWATEYTKLAFLGGYGPELAGAAAAGGANFGTNLLAQKRERARLRQEHPELAAQMDAEGLDVAGAGAKAIPAALWGGIGTGIGHAFLGAPGAVIGGGISTAANLDRGSQAGAETVRNRFQPA